MKFLLMTLGLALAVTTGALAADKEKPAHSDKLLHVVAFKYKPSATPEQIEASVEAFRALKKKISQIQTLEWGTNVSPEKHDKGFTHGFVLSFKTAKDRDEYLVHPEHKAFGKSLGPIIDDVFVIDYWAQH
jgi:hypothetical protein